MEIAPLHGSFPLIHSLDVPSAPEPHHGEAARLHEEDDKTKAAASHAKMRAAMRKSIAPHMQSSHGAELV